jgi:hypothetical protein
MSNGPVPSALYDGLKFVKGTNDYMGSLYAFKDAFDVVKHFVSAKREADLEILSKSDIAFLDKSIEDHKDMTFKQLTDKSHDSAWDKAYANGDMDALEIAAAKGVPASMLHYIQEVLGNHRLMKYGY